jgi:hypothetical protein
MDAFGFLYEYIGPALYALFPISVFCWGLILYVLYSICTKQEINEWVEVFLAHFKETATLIGLLGSVYALTSSFQVEGFTGEEIRNQMFKTLSTGFWSTIAGVIVSLVASMGLLAMKRT